MSTAERQAVTQERRDAIMRFVAAYRAEHDQGPSLEEIRQHIGLRSLGNVARHVAAMVEEGRLLKVPGKNRSLRVPPVVEKMLAAV